MPTYRVHRPTRRPTRRPRIPIRRASYVRIPRAPKQNLNARIKALEKGTVAHRQYQKTNTGKFPTVAQLAEGQHYHVHMITNPSSWTDVFQSEAMDEAELPRKYDMKKIRMKWMLQPELSTNTTDCFVQLFIVSLKVASAQVVIEETENLVNLDEGKHYCNVALDSADGAAYGKGFYYLNKAYFNIHTHRQYRFGNETLGGVAVSNIDDGTVMGSHTMTWKKQIKSFTKDSFKTIDGDHLRDTTRLWYLIFCNNTTADELFWSSNALITGTTVAGQ